MGSGLSFGRVLKHDYPCFMFALAGPIALGLAIFIQVMGFIPSRSEKKVDPKFARGALIVAAGLTVVFGGLCAARTARLRRIASAGQETDATILAVNFFKDRGRVDFAYDWNGTRHVDGHAVMKTAETEAMAPGDLLRVAVDPLKTSRAVPVDLFRRRP